MGGGEAFKEQTVIQSGALSCYKHSCLSRALWITQNTASFFIMKFYRAYSCNGNNVDSYLEDVRFESRPEHRLSYEDINGFPRAIFRILQELSRDRLLPNPFQSSVTCHLSAMKL
jgi:hypothetical protein